ncbi:hypothetical protein SLEP1_g48433 [Rubroshorea leprosula]|uniref:Uncharacterized protein n=1 Tax=Rubroshorea leprosula TaxID=152421 RepID=A0AAV5LUJ0_9ROSI|nr:hypothetical protein SLEP1_g48433 [Rubroshorea leprosula]
MEQLTQTEMNRLKSLEDGGCFPTATTTKPLIQRVTHLLLQDNEDFERYFKPISVALGPLHHDNSPDSKLQRGEKSKLQMATKFIEYSGTAKEAFYIIVKAEINSLRECYDSKQIETWSDEDLAWMFLVDGCAVLFLIDHVATENLKELGCKDDLLAYVKIDLLLLENQLPYRLLQILMRFCAGVPRPNPLDKKYKNKSAAEVLKESIDNFINKNAMSLVEQKQKKQQTTAAATTTAIMIDSQREPAHLLELLWRRLTQQQQQQQQQTAAAATTTAITIDTQREPAHLLKLLSRRLTKSEKDKEPDGTISKLLKKLRPSGDKGSDVTISKCISSNSNSGDKNSHWRPKFRSVKELKEKGIWLKVSKSGRIKDIDFRGYFLGAALKLPPITVDPFTWPKLMNLIAYEMCPDFENNFEITSYVSFLDSLIDQREDVKIMRDAGVLYNELGSDKAVALLFNKISNLVPKPRLQNPNLRDCMIRIQAHCDSAFANYVAQLYHTYFKSPWSMLAFFGALLGLALTAIQTYEGF